MKNFRSFVFFACLAVLGLGLYLFQPSGAEVSGLPASTGNSSPASSLAGTRSEPVRVGVGATRKTLTAAEGAFSTEMARLVDGIHAGRVVRVQVGDEARSYLFRPKRITTDGFRISAGPNAEYPGAFEVFEGRQVLADGRLVGMAKLAVVNDTLSMAYVTPAGDFLIEQNGEGKLIARSLLNRDNGSTWGALEMCRRWQDRGYRPGVQRRNTAARDGCRNFSGCLSFRGT